MPLGFLATVFLENLNMMKGLPLQALHIASLMLKGNILKTSGAQVVVELKDAAALHWVLILSTTSA